MMSFYDVIVIVWLLGEFDNRSVVFRWKETLLVCVSLAKRVLTRTSAVMLNVWTVFSPIGITWYSQILLTGLLVSSKFVLLPNFLVVVVFKQPSKARFSQLLPFSLCSYTWHCAFLTFLHVFMRSRTSLSPVVCVHELMISRFHSLWISFRSWELCTLVIVQSQRVAAIRLVLLRRVCVTPELRTSSPRLCSAACKPQWNSARFSVCPSKWSQRPWKP